MITELKKYSAYKESGLLWLGESPAHWDLLPNRALMHRRKTLVGSRHTEHPLLSLTKKGVIVRDVESGKGKFTADMSTFQEVHKGDLIFCLFDIPETPRTVGLSNDNGMITGAYTVFECPDPTLAAFLNLFYQAMDDRKLLSPLYSGLRNTIQATRFLGIKTPVPSSSEQSSIVRFLNHADRRIKRCILAKQKMIKLLEEQKQATIHQAVTRGLDPNVRLKPSGVEWLGDVPEHWRLRKLRTILNGVTDRDRPDLPLLSVVREKGVILRDINDKDENHNFVPDDLSNYKVVRIGQFAMNKMKAWQGSYGVSEYDGIVSPAYFIFNLEEVSGAFFHLAIRSKVYVPFFTQASDGVRTGQWDLSLAQMKEIPFLIPPLPEQLSLTSFIDGVIVKSTAAKDRIRNEILLLDEYRTRLIADVVTGKLDVREATKNLPEELNETEKIEEVDLSAEGDGGDEEREAESEEIEA